MNLPPTIETDEVICQCYQVNESTIRNAIAAERLNDIDSVTEACEAGGAIPAIFSFSFLSTSIRKKPPQWKT